MYQYVCICKFLSHSAGLFSLFISSLAVKTLIFHFLIQIPRNLTSTNITTMKINFISKKVKQSCKAGDILVIWTFTDLPCSFFLPLFLIGVSQQKTLKPNHPHTIAHNNYYR